MFRFYLYLFHHFTLIVFVASQHRFIISASFSPAVEGDKLTYYVMDIEERFLKLNNPLLLLDSQPGSPVLGENDRGISQNISKLRLSWHLTNNYAYRLSSVTLWSP